ncbi:hypothetical protein [Actinoplanes sp. NBRC 101535]|uniref:hypothetical protein n=1 Tax=Actinoplanes sp. NBRC 101535 TaxID=3032196 RepID=UPI002552F08A|nr:hypothetical protein [Actinoplanes sp. NBRC 101535]
MPAAAGRETHGGWGDEGTPRPEEVGKIPAHPFTVGRQRCGKPGSDRAWNAPCGRRSITVAAIRENIEGLVASRRNLASDEVAAAIAYITGQPAHVLINELQVRPISHV